MDPGEMAMAHHFNVPVRQQTKVDPLTVASHWNSRAAQVTIDIVRQYQSCGGDSSSIHR
jgi:hypothetical protein